MIVKLSQPLLFYKNEVCATEQVEEIRLMIWEDFLFHHVPYETRWKFFACTMLEQPVFLVQTPKFDNAHHVHYQISAFEQSRLRLYFRRIIILFQK